MVTAPELYGGSLIPMLSSGQVDHLLIQSFLQAMRAWEDWVFPIWENKSRQSERKSFRDFLYGDLDDLRLGF